MVRRQERKLYHLGTPKALTDASGQVVWKASYSPFGKASINRESNDEYGYIHFYYYCSFGS
ncbi:RHS domain-containing protein [Aeromonas rivipollensis]|uniref:RHS domain-containing protein n=1 Tax=Aeromonas rivipollensis TaxID=948519 RepID=UPI003D19CBE8